MFFYSNKKLKIVYKTHSPSIEVKYTQIVDRNGTESIQTTTSSFCIYRVYSIGILWKTKQQHLCFVFRYIFRNINIEQINVNWKLLWYTLDIIRGNKTFPSARIESNLYDQTNKLNKTTQNGQVLCLSKCKSPSFYFHLFTHSDCFRYVFEFSIF